MVSELLYDHCGTFGSIFKHFKHFQAFSSIFAVAQRAFTVGFEILKCSYLKILKNVSFGSLDLMFQHGVVSSKREKREGVI